MFSCSILEDVQPIIQIRWTEFYVNEVMYKKISAAKKQAAAIEEITRIKAPSDGKCSKIGYTERYNSGVLLSRFTLFLLLLFCALLIDI